MGNFTSDAFWTDVSATTRKAMMSHARAALARSGMDAASIPTGSGDTESLARAGTAMVGRIFTMLRDMETLLVEDQPPPPQVQALAELIRAYQFVAQDIWNTVAGDRVWEQRQSVKALKQVTDKLEALNGLHHECHALAQEKVVQSYSARFLLAWLTPRKDLDVKLAAALGYAATPAPAPDAPPASKRKSSRQRGGSHT